MTEHYTIHQLADSKGISVPVRAALLALEGRVRELESQAELHFGTLTLRLGYNPGTIWIGQDGGEGGEFPVSEVEAMLQAYYEENF